MAKRSVRDERANKKSIRLVVAATLILTLILSAQIIRLRGKNRELDSHLSALSAQVTAAQQENEILTEKAGKPLSEEEILELARQRFGLVFPNEIVFIPEE